MCVGEPDAFCRQSVEMGAVDPGDTVTREVPPQVVPMNDQDVISRSRHVGKASCPAHVRQQLESAGSQLFLPSCLIHPRVSAGSMTSSSSNVVAAISALPCA